MLTTHPTFPLLSKAPVIEAIIGISLLAPDNILPSLKALNASLPSPYPGVSEILELQAKIEFKLESETTSSKRQVGWQFISQDTRQAYQARLNGFSFHRLAPYENWDTFLASARALWLKYRSAVGQIPIKQFSVRYINSIELPLGEEISDYLSVYPEIPKGLPQKLSRYSMNLELPLTGRSDGLLLVRHALNPFDQAKPDVVTVIMDNDFVLFSEPSLSDDEMWIRINALREIKNTTFKDSITPKMLDLLR